jgi:hypothetical protein
LSTAQVQALTTGQVAALNYAQVSVLVSELSTSQIPYMTSV